MSGTEFTNILANQVHVILENNLFIDKIFQTFLTIFCNHFFTKISLFQNFVLCRICIISLLEYFCEVIQYVRLLKGCIEGNRPFEIAQMQLDFHSSTYLACKALKGLLKITHNKLCDCL